MKKKKYRTPELEEGAFWKNNFKFDQLSDVPTEVVHLNLKESTVTDDELAIICSRVRRIEMLDLHYTSITNEGIRHLLKLESLLELRLKENTGIDNGCMTYINGLKELRFLHLRGTAVNVIGLEQITSLQSLRTVLISDDRPEAQTDEEMKSIVRAMPDCFFSVNGKCWHPLQPWEKLMMEQGEQ